MSCGNVNNERGKKREKCHEKTEQQTFRAEFGFVDHSTEKQLSIEFRTKSLITSGVYRELISGSRCLARVSK